MEKFEHSDNRMNLSDATASTWKEFNGFAVNALVNSLAALKIENAALKAENEALKKSAPLSGERTPSP